MQENVQAALIILFNHNYEANLERLDKIYGDRFSNIFYIMPFYTGTRSDVIPVYENSFYFQGYISKALGQIKNAQYQHYIVIGDDLLLHPTINEHNYQQYFEVNAETAFIPGFFLLNDVEETRPNRPMAPFWPWVLKAIDFNIEEGGIEVKKFLPTYAEALALLKRHGIIFTPDVPAKSYYYKGYLAPTSPENQQYKKVYGQLLKKIAISIARKKKISYPLVGSYSDCVVIPHKYVDEIIKYYGIFAALNLFVEIALPTGLALAVPKIISEDDTRMKGVTYWAPKEFAEFEKKYNNSLDNLSNNFPADALYIHPVKLSKWK
ncbi:MAG TPA: hypothetical protein VF610_00120 [Segetibacter sp.]|jgi:hypothetical protein